jgi:hypothetical protein
VSDEGTMRDFEVALMDAISTICEVLVARRIIRAEVLAEMLRRQRETYPKEEMPGAVFVMDVILEALTDPARAEARKLLEDPPEGSA